MDQIMLARLRSQRGATEISQFPLVIYAMFLVLLIPLLDLMTLLLGGATQFLATNDFASKAATQTDFNKALNSMANEAYQFQGNSLAKFVKMQPIGGYVGCGDDLYVVATSIASGAVTSSDADQAMSQTINTTQTMYELQVKSSYSISPLISMSSFPLLGSVPGLGQPVVLTFSASRPVEHPGGLQSNTGNSNGSSSTAVSTFTRSSLANANATAGQPGMPPYIWRTADIYQQIAAAGQTVVSVNVFTDLANDDWTSSHVTATAGQSLWIDTLADPLWGRYGGGGDPAAGIGPPQPDLRQTIPLQTANYDSLIGYVGNAPSGYPAPGQIGYTYLSSTFAGNPSIFPVGSTLSSYKVPGTGLLSFMCNTEGIRGQTTNSYGGPANPGFQTIRVIVTQ